MRGKHMNMKYDVIDFRITPADAGKTSQINRTVMLSWDHPRGCGENAAIVRPHTHPMGSPPRMRGKRATRLRTAKSDRITPADAGKTVVQ